MQFGYFICFLENIETSYHMNCILQYLFFFYLTYVYNNFFEITYSPMINLAKVSQYGE